MEATGLKGLIEFLMIWGWKSNFLHLKTEGLKGLILLLKVGGHLSMCLVERNARIEWPTLAVIGAIYASWLALTWFHALIPLWLWLPLAAWTGAWWSSVQHEILHGHPTRNRRLNTALATPCFWLWLPYERYRQVHLVHHRDERLTDPLDDPESRYLTPESWRALGFVGRALVAAQGVLLGRLIVGPLWSIAAFWAADARAVAAGDRRVARIWAWHLLQVALILAWAVWACGLPLWQYLLGFTYLATALALIRSFAEHRAAGGVAERTAIVENSSVLGLLFLHNNLHAVHHACPSVAWYRLPRLYREHRAAFLEHNGGLLYHGYGEVFRRFLFHRHDRPIHPFGRVPDAGGRPATP
jgi:fatty acid desaturase